MIAQQNRNNCSSVNSNYNLLFISQSVHVSVCVCPPVCQQEYIRSDEVQGHNCKLYPIFHNTNFWS